MVASQELIALVHKTALGMTRLLSTQHHRLGGVTDGWIVVRPRESFFLHITNAYRTQLGSYMLEDLTRRMVLLNPHQKKNERSVGF